MLSEQGSDHDKVIEHMLSTKLEPWSRGVKWTFETVGSVDASPAIGSDGTVYVGSSYYGNALFHGHFYAFHPNGWMKWMFETAGLVCSSLAVGADGTLYAGSSCWDWDNPPHSGYFYAIHPDGTVKWMFETKGSVLSSPVIDADGTIYAGSTDKHLYAFYPDGRVKWMVETTGPVCSSPAIGWDGTIYVGSDDGSLYALGEARPTPVEEPLDHRTIPQVFALQQNAPNPFNTSTIIGYALPRSVDVGLKVYDLRGQEVITLVEGYQEAGQYQVCWDGRDQQGRPVASGIYVYRLQTGEFEAVKRMTLVR